MLPIIILIITVLLITFQQGSALRSVTDEFLNWFRNTSDSDPVKKVFIDNKLIAVDYDPLAFSTNCLSAGIDSPALLIYCLVIAIIWLAVVSTGLYFYFQKLYKNLNKLGTSHIELQRLERNAV